MQNKISQIMFAFQNTVEASDLAKNSLIICSRKFPVIIDAKITHFNTKLSYKFSFFDSIRTLRMMLIFLTCMKISKLQYSLCLTWRLLADKQTEMNIKKKIYAKKQQYLIERRVSVPILSRALMGTARAQITVLIT